MSDAEVRVLVVDDSAFARKVLREVIAARPEMKVVGIARDGLDALEQIEALSPDVVTLDLSMPNLDGVEVLRALQSRPNAPSVVVVSMSDEDSEIAVAALQAGAFDIVKKPTALAIDRLYEISEQLTETIRLAARTRREKAAAGVRATPLPTPTAPPPGRASLVVIGASTGGPQALTHLIGALPRDFPVPVAVVLHMPAGYTETFARRLDKDCAIDVEEAHEGLGLRPGLVVIARAGYHLSITKTESGFAAQLPLEPFDTLHRPAVDVLFESAARVAGKGALGIVLTGMGTDGLVGARAIRAAGGRLLTETEASCVVYGMPRAVFEAGLGAREASVQQMHALLVSAL